MFTIGLEISLKNLLAMKKIVLIGGTLQLVLTTVAVCIIMMAFGFSFNVSLFIGFLVAHSSTAIIMNIYQKSGEIDTRHGKIALGLLIFQDLNVVPMMMAVPLLAGTAGTDIGSSVLNFFVGIGILVVILAAAVYLVPRFLRFIALTRSGELFVMAIVLICFGIAWLMSLNGVSLALGAFLAGVAISGSDYSHEVIGQIMPIRDLLTSFFFVSIGMMLNLGYLWNHLALIAGLAVLLLLGKTLLNFISVKVIGVATGAAVLSAVGLSQIGEFSFILGSTGLEAGILSNDIYQIFLAISIVTMALTPFLVAAAPKLVNRFFVKDMPDGESQKAAGQEIIVGFGLAGQYVAKALEKMSIPYIVLEMNAETVAREKKRGVNIIYGDASREAVLDFAGVHSAETIVITMPQMEAVKAIVTTARRMNPKIAIITRSRFISETSELYKLGADEVIVDERETAIQIFKRILASKQVPVQDIDQFGREMRNELYDKYIETPENVRLPRAERNMLFESILVRAKQADDRISSEMSRVEQVRVEKGCDACGKRLCDIHLRAEYGISVLAVKRAGAADAVVSPDGETELCEGDTVVVIGERSALAKMMGLFLPE
ncbi:MAG: cation:proton antiporter, partial [Methanocorpusculum sp.]|nr:cation:proton antiporter [Methanocorpusculum sp.]